MATNMVGTPNADGWTLYDPFQGGTHHPEVEAERKRNAAADAARRAALPYWEALLPRADAALAEKQAAVGPITARLQTAQAAYNRRYKQVVGGQAVRDPVVGLPIIPQDDERVEPELGRRRLIERELAQANVEIGAAQQARDGVNAEICWIKGTVPWSA